MPNVPGALRTLCAPQSSTFGTNRWAKAPGWANASAREFITRRFVRGIKTLRGNSCAIAQPKSQLRGITQCGRAAGMTSVRSAVIQMTSTPDVEANLSQAEVLVAGAAADGARLIVLPECFAYLGPDKQHAGVAEPLPAGGAILARAAGWAREHGAELILGGFWEAAGDKVRNACVHLAADGNVSAVYRKIHLFDVDLPDGTSLKESATIEPGDEAVVTQTAAGVLGLSVCYDLRFPELYRRLIDQGATLLAVPSAFTATTGKDHWHILLRARAIESQSFVLAAAQVGHHFGKRRSYGHALIADPWGRVLAECDGDEPGFAVADLDDLVVKRVRKQLPSLAHRRL